MVSIERFPLRARTPFDQMTDMKQLVVACMLFALSHGASASEEEAAFYVAPRIGIGQMRVRAFSGVNDFTEEHDTIDAGVSGGYLTSTGLAIELGLGSQTSANLFDTFDGFHLYQEFALFGYAIALSDRVRLTPKIGVSHWTLESKEGTLLNPGPEAVKKTSGYQTVAELEVTTKVNSFLSLGGAIRQSDFEFGRAGSIVFLAKFEF